MDIFLLILKIIGIILLSILGLILFVLIVLLVTPFRYRLTGSYKEKKPDVLLNIHFWFHLISAKVYYNENGLSGNIRILFIKKNILSKKPKDDGEQSVENDDLQMYMDQIEELEDVASSDKPVNEEEPSEEEKIESVQEKEEKPENEAVESSENTDDLEEEIDDEPRTLLDKIVGKIRGIYEKIVNLIEKLQRKEAAVKWFLGLGSTKRILKVLWRQLVKTLKSIMPRKLKGSLLLGLDNPQTMGMICSYSALVYPSFPKNFEFTPVFDEKIIDGEGDIKGRIILGAVLGHLLVIVLRRDFFRTIKNLKRFKQLWR